MNSNTSLLCLVVYGLTTGSRTSTLRLYLNLHLFLNFADRHALSGIEWVWSLHCLAHAILGMRRRVKVQNSVLQWCACHWQDWQLSKWRSLETDISWKWRPENGVDLCGKVLSECRVRRKKKKEKGQFLTASGSVGRWPFWTVRLSILVVFHT